MIKEAGHSFSIKKTLRTEAGRPLAIKKMIVQEGWLGPSFAEALTQEGQPHQTIVGAYFSLPAIRPTGGWRSL
jgi:hypothetical protein